MLNIALNRSKYVFGTRSLTYIYNCTLMSIGPTVIDKLVVCFKRSLDNILNCASGIVHIYFRQNGCGFSKNIQSNCSIFRWISWIGFQIIQKRIRFRFQIQKYIRFKTDISWKSVIVLSYLHVSFLYSFYLIFTGHVKLLTVAFGKMEHISAAVRSHFISNSISSVHVDGDNRFWHNRGCSSIVGSSSIQGQQAIASISHDTQFHDISKLHIWMGTWSSVSEILVRRNKLLLSWWTNAIKASS